MGGELGIKIKNLRCSDGLVNPFNDYRSKPQIDLSIMSENNECLHICGENDWGYLALDILKPILQKGIQLYLEIREKIYSQKPEVVLVGKNEFRILDILHIARDSEQGIETMLDVPIVKGDFDNGVK